MKTTTSNPRRARWGTRTVAPVDSIVAGEVINVLVVIVVIIVIAVVVVVVSRDMAAEDGVSGAGVAVAALYLIPWLMNVECSIITPSHPDRFGTPFPYHHHRPPVPTPPTTFLCRLPPLLIVKCFPLLLPTIVMPQRPHLRTWMTLLFVVIAAVIFSSPLRPHLLHSIGASAPS